MTPPLVGTVHDFVGFRKSSRKAGVPEEVLQKMAEVYPQPSHPIIRTHPETGKQSVYINQVYLVIWTSAPPHEAASCIPHAPFLASTLCRCPLLCSTHPPNTPNTHFASPHFASPHFGTLLFLQAFTQYVEGVPVEEGDKLANALYKMATVPEYQCRFHWETGSLAFWDNRACQHVSGRGRFYRSVWSFLLCIIVDFVSDLVRSTQ
jgi:alpha-ketoglutarate-dependent taurine dioxygenase